MKNPLTPAGIESATFRINHHATTIFLIVCHPVIFITVDLTGKHTSILGSKIRLCRQCGQARPFSQNRQK